MCVLPALSWSSEAQRSASYRSSTRALTARLRREKASTMSGASSSAILTETAGACSRYPPVPRTGRTGDMGKVTSGLTMSLDGFIAGPNDGPEHPLGEGGMRLFDWYSSGDTDYVVPSGGMTFKVSSQAATLIISSSPAPHPKCAEMQVAGILVPGVVNMMELDITQPSSGKNKLG